MTNFVFLPEAYLCEEETREQSKEKIREGFVSEVKTFVEGYANRGVPLRINLHPFYHVNEISYADSSLDEFMNAATDVWQLLAQTNERISDKQMRVSAYIGVQDNGYASESWKNQINAWRKTIDQMNLEGSGFKCTS